MLVKVGMKQKTKSAGGAKTSQEWASLLPAASQAESSLAS
jgi:hypothetical protein